MDKTVRVLLIEANIRDACHVSEALAGFGGVRYDLEHCDSLSRGVERLGAGGVDTVLVDLAQPDSNGLDTLAAIRESAESIPIIVLSAFHDRTLARRVVQEGAQDYLVVGRVDSDSLGRAIHYAIERKAVERQVIEALHEAEEAGRAKSEFLSNVSHEIRTPLTSMRNVLSNLKVGVGGRLKPKQIEYLNMLDEDCIRLCSLVEKLLNLSRLRAGKVSVDFDSTDLVRVTEKAVGGLKREAQARGVALDVAMSDSLPEVYSDGSLLLQVFTNLVSNAIKSTPSGGSITVRGEDLGADVLVSVIDTGIGIAPEDQEKIFEKFVQLNRAKDGARSHGTGIGLAICKEIVDLHGGRIWVESTVGKGSCFRFTLPTRECATHAAGAGETAGVKSEFLEV